MSTELASERSGEQTRNVRTSDLYVVPDEEQVAHRGELALGADLPSRARRRSPWERLGANLRLERPWGALPWERKNPGPVKDRGSNVSTLVEATYSKWNSILSELIAMSGIVERFREKEFASIKQ